MCCPPHPTARIRPIASCGKTISTAQRSLPTADQPDQRRGSWAVTGVEGQLAVAAAAHQQPPGHAGSGQGGKLHGHPARRHQGRDRAAEHHPSTRKGRAWTLIDTNTVVQVPKAGPSNSPASGPRSQNSSPTATASQPQAGRCTCSGDSSRRSTAGQSWSASDSVRAMARDASPPAGQEGGPQEQVRRPAVSR